MTVAEIVKGLGLSVAAEGDLSRSVRGGYCSDLLSDVLAHVESGDIWVTHQRHMNVVAVAKLKEVAAVVIVRDAAPGEEVRARAEHEGVNLLVSSEGAFEVVGRLYPLVAG